LAQQVRQYDQRVLVDQRKVVYRQQRVRVVSQYGEEPVGRPDDRWDRRLLREGQFLGQSVGQRPGIPAAELVEVGDGVRECCVGQAAIELVGPHVNGEPSVFGMSRHDPVEKR
jgi:hypothetical protein